MTVDPRVRELEFAIAEIWRTYGIFVSNGGGAFKRHVEPAIFAAVKLLPIELRHRQEHTGIRKKKARCHHPYAKSDGNTDWPGLVCADCGAVIPEASEQDYE